jgi:hypothetical protein
MIAVGLLDHMGTPADNSRCGEERHVQLARQTEIVEQPREGPINVGGELALFPNRALNRIGDLFHRLTSAGTRQLSTVRL